MKILAIRGKNLASLEGEFEVDFTVEPLRSAGIFAITGQTGSGKSTLLDALCLALFDETPRNNRTTENINIVDVKERTINQKDSRNILRRGTSDGYAEVDFVSLGGETFRSRWGVRRSRDKVDGSLQATDFKLINRSTNIEVQGRKTELLAKVVELIGLTFDQFTRAVLLAQGDFATFLKATQKEKAELLEKLTGTDIYSRISVSIYEKSKAAENDLALLNERIKDIELLTDEDIEALTNEKQTAVTEMEQLKAQTAELAAKIKWIIDQEALIKNVEQAQKQLDEAQGAIEQAKPRYEYLAQIDSVQEIRDSYTELKSTEKQIAENRKNLTAQESLRDANAKLLAEAQQKVVVCEAEQKQHLETISTIEPQIRQARALDIRIEGAKANRKEANAEYEQFVKSKSKIEKSIATTESSIKVAEQKIMEIATWFDNNSQYKEIIPRVELVINLLDDAVTATKQGANNTKILADNETVLTSDRLKRTTLRAEAERLDSLLPAEIATLREKLVDGAPCPVCGSVHHPMSGVEGESLEQAELNRAKRDVSVKITKLTESIEVRERENIRLKSVIDGYITQSKEATNKLATYLRDLPDWQRLFEEGTLQKSLSDTAGNWNTYSNERAKANEQISSLQTTLSSEKKNFEEIVQALVQKEQKLKSCDAELEKLSTERANILSGRDTDEVLEQLNKKGREIADHLTKFTTEKGNFTAKGEKIAGVITQILQDFAKLAEQNTIAQKTVENWISAKNGAITQEQLTELFSKDSHWLAAEREGLNRLYESKTTAQATIAERRKTLEKHNEAQVKPSPDENREELQILAAGKNEQLEQKSKRSTEIELRLATHAQSKQKIKAYEKELEEKRTLSDNWKKLSEMFGSADGAKFKVLAQGYTLDALLTYANKHLHELSRRYELQRIADTLALQVVDLDMLGEIRTVHSLSGGESFLISLALALGLSSLSSNKMKVESLFIDEGFGSLDIDTLRVAMDALENLQTQGRKIGVISHVAEMTERITTQIKVIKTVNGRSKIEIV